MAVSRCGSGRAQRRMTVAVASLLVAATASCAPPPAPPAASPPAPRATRPAPLDASKPVLRICQALVQPVGSRIAVRGEFNGAAYSTTTLTLESVERCNSSGTGVVVASVWDREELARIADGLPPGKRVFHPVSVVILEGEIAKVEQESIVRLERSFKRPVVVLTRSIIRSMIPRFLAVLAPGALSGNSTDRIWPLIHSQLSTHASVHRSDDCRRLRPQEHRPLRH
jgi:hypothetical protein